MTFPPIFLRIVRARVGNLDSVTWNHSPRKEDRKIFAVIGIVGLAIVFVFLQASGPGPSGMASYVVDSAAIFFKKIVVSRRSSC